MNEQYKRLVNEIFPDDVMTQIANKTSVDKIDVEHICIEIIARVLGDGSDLTKKAIEHRIKKVVENEQLKALIKRLETKYDISSKTASVVLGELLPAIFRKVSNLDSNLFENHERHEVQYKALEEAKTIDQIKDEETSDTSVDDVFKNIENNAIKDEKSKFNIEVDNKPKKKVSLFSKKPKKEKKLEIKRESIVSTEKSELSIIEKICVIAVLAALVALIASFVILIIKQKI